MAGVDVDAPSGPDGQSILQRFLSGEWGDPGVMTLDESRRHLAEWANGHPDIHEPRAYPFHDSPPEVMSGLRVHLAAEWTHAVLGLGVAQFYPSWRGPVHPTILYDGEVARDALVQAGRRLRSIGVRTPPALFVVPGDFVAGARG